MVSKGLFNVEFYNENSENLKNIQIRFYIEDLQIRLKKKFKKENLICQNEGINSKEEVIEIIGKEIWIEENSLEKKTLMNIFI